MFKVLRRAILWTGLVLSWGYCAASSFLLANAHALTHTGWQVGIGERGTQMLIVSFACFCFLSVVAIWKLDR